jgi:tetratricopeptide (TPR) repeat protein
MPSKPLEKSPPKGSAPSAAAVSDYQKLVSFLELSSGFNLAVARCNIPALRKELITRVARDAAQRGIAVQHVDLTNRYRGDFVEALRQGLPPSSPGKPLALMVTGIDGLIYKTAAPRKKVEEGRPAFVARLNFDRERLAEKVPFPMVLWLEAESLNLFLREAPDLTQWISVHFDFGKPVAEALDFTRWLRNQPPLPQQTTERRLEEIGDVDALLRELQATRKKRNLGARRRRLAALQSLGERNFWLGQAGKAKVAATRALSVAKSIGDLRAEGMALGLLGKAYADLGQARKSSEYARRELAIAHQLQDRRGESLALANLAAAHANLGETRQAIDFGSQGLRIAREITDRKGEGGALNVLGYVHRILGENQKALEFHEQHLAITREIGDRRGEGVALLNLGVAYHSLGELRKAISSYEQGLEIAKEVGNRSAEAINVGNLGAAYMALGEPRKAIEILQQSLALARELGNRDTEAMALANLALCHSHFGEIPKARRAAQRALRIFKRIESPNAPMLEDWLSLWRKPEAQGRFAGSRPSG